MSERTNTEIASDDDAPTGCAERGIECEGCSENFDAGELEDGFCSTCVDRVPETDGDKSGNASITAEEFNERFAARMLKVAGPSFSDGASIATYAAQAAPTYFEDLDQRAEGPEACADADMSYWGD